MRAGVPRRARPADRRHRHEQHAHHDRGAPKRSRDVDGVVAALVVVPYYVRPSEAGIVDAPRSRRRREPGADRRLQHPGAHRPRPRRRLDARRSPRIPNIAGVKQAVATLDVDTLEVLAEAPAGFSVLGGEDTMLFPLMCMGARRHDLARRRTSCTERFVAMIECGLAGKIDDGRAHAEALLPVVRAGFAEPNPAVFKGVLARAGPDRHARSPPADDERVRRSYRRPARCDRNGGALVRSRA